MSRPNRAGWTAPRRAVVVGAGMVGLATAWFLRERGLEVTVLDRAGVAAGSSWGNAGWLSPSLARPLAEPALLRAVPPALFDPNASLRIPVRPDPELLGFLARFAMRCTRRAWAQAMAALVPLNRLALPTFDELADQVTNRVPECGGQAVTHQAPIMAAFEHPEQAEQWCHELELMSDAGQAVTITEATPTPLLSPRVRTVLRLEGQRFIDPGGFVAALANAVRAGGGQIVDGVTVCAVAPVNHELEVRTTGGEPYRADAVVLATGAWLPRLARALGVRTRVQAGRGYSFSVAVERPPETPIYLPAVRVACSPYRGRLRVTGTMELRRADAPPDWNRVRAIVRSAKPLLAEVDWSDRRDPWLGPRPMTPDGLPLVGATALPGVYVSGGHGMWGMTLGPITGRLLAEQISTGETPAELRPFDPLR